jgi:hypothetical protein
MLTWGYIFVVNRFCCYFLIYLWLQFLLTCLLFPFSLEEHSFVWMKQTQNRKLVVRMSTQSMNKAPVHMRTFSPDFAFLLDINSISDSAGESSPC